MLLYFHVVLQAPGNPLLAPARPHTLQRGRFEKSLILSSFGDQMSSLISIIDLVAYVGVLIRSSYA